MAPFEKYFKQNFFGQAFQNILRANGYSGVLGLLSKKRKKKKRKNGLFIKNKPWEISVFAAPVEKMIFKNENFTEPKDIFLTVWTARVLGLLSKKRKKERVVFEQKEKPRAKHFF